MLRRLLHCGDGTWQREYAQLHSSILAGRAEPRYLLAHGQNGVQQIRLTYKCTPCPQAVRRYDVEHASGAGFGAVSKCQVSACRRRHDAGRGTTAGNTSSKGRKAGSVCGGAAGLADSLVGAVTLFWVAVLQRRAFAMKFGAFGAYEWAFDQPHINWTW